MAQGNVQLCAECGLAYRSLRASFLSCYSLQSMGFQAFFFFARIDYQDKLLRLDSRTMQIVWKPPQLNGSKSSYIFTHSRKGHLTTDQQGTIQSSSQLRETTTQSTLSSVPRTKQPTDPLLQSTTDPKAARQFTKDKIEVIIHRRLIVDDGRGVGEPLNETGQDNQGLMQFVRHYVMFQGDYRTVQKWNDQRILPSFAVSASNAFSRASIRRAYINVSSPVKLYLRPFEDGSYLLRFHNTNPTTKATFSLPDEWKITEQTLAANQLTSDWKKKQFIWNEDKKESQGGRKIKLVRKD